MFLFQRDIAGSDIAACEPYKPKRAAAGKETQYLPGVSLPQQKQLKQGARGAAMATDEKSRSWESPKGLFSFKHLLTTGLGLASIILTDNPGVLFGVHCAVQEWTCGLYMRGISLQCNYRAQLDNHEPTI